jgi:ankyrin repeat protein
VVKLLLAREDVDVNSKDQFGMDTLFICCSFGSDRTAELFLAREDVDVNSKNNYGRTPLSHVQSGDAENSQAAPCTGRY